MNGTAFGNAEGGKTVQECVPTGHGQAVRVLMTAGAIVAGAVLLIGAMVAPLWAQSYPTKPIRLIIPMATGGAADVVGRIIGLKLAEWLGQSVVPENRVGAGGNIAYEYTAKARPDGYTIVFGSSLLASGPGLYKKLNYDPIRDLVPISMVARVPYVLIVRPSLPVNSLQELIQYAKANPGKLNFGSSGIGAAPHLAQEQLKSMAKIDISHVPFKGGAQVMVGMIGGEVDMYVGPLPTSLPQIRAGKVRALAVLRDERLPELPNVPTAKEAGTDNWEVYAWYGLLAPVGTSRDIVNRLNAEWISIEAMPETKEQLRKAGFEPLSGTPEQFSEFLKAEILRWGKVIREAKIPNLD
jgi:tripartite-type tricarboxylate transporter receptor subunit TctC